ncbi:hypothetical protein C4D60_Mb04t00100 [Musa balbisiana]|uniref:non-specific serine/threonine protein kinase n=1 Tax=Musa balbisiana TaxID=52838 RepID=A0A4S8K8L4_MUSBA|nr:hypothetical protein C4D60_Mb04t00100 [Musa balbisiana]
MCHPVPVRGAASSCSPASACGRIPSLPVSTHRERHRAPASPGFEHLGLLRRLPMIGVFLIFYGAIMTISPTFIPHVTQARSTDSLEISALRIIRGSLIDNMNNLKSWSNGDPCTSNWTGIFCYNAPNDGYLHIRELQLLNLNLSGTLAPELGLLSHLEILDFMWNGIHGPIPKEIGNITSLKLLLLNGNHIYGSLPDEIGNLYNLNRLQIDQNQISGSIPKSFANLSKIKHLHMNNNLLSGQIPPELSRLPILYHFLADNNNFSGYLPPELASLPSLKILQLDNNNFSGSSIPVSFSNMTMLVKLSLRNCSLQGTIPDLSQIPRLGYLDLSWNQLKGPLPSKLSIDITTIDLSHNYLNGTIPLTFSGLPKLQKLSLANNLLTGSVPSSIWQNMTFNTNDTLLLDFQKNSLTDISDDYSPPANVTILLYGNPVCDSENQLDIAHFCQLRTIAKHLEIQQNLKSCVSDAQLRAHPLSPMQCLCTVPLGVGFRLKSPGISDFRSYINDFEINLTSLLHLFVYQLGILAGWEITLSDVFGPYELLNFTLGSYASDIPDTSESGLSKNAMVGILVGAVAGAIAVSVAVTVLIMRRYRALRTSIKINDVKCFTFEDMVQATSNFSNSTQVGQGGYGKVYRGTLVDGTPVAIKRAQEGSLQGSKEFSTEIELLSRLHHRNLVSLVGYCNEQDEQGYLDPEYFLTHKLTDKSDVYSLGVVFLELLTGMRPISHGKNIVREVKTACQCGLMFSIIDSRMNAYPSECMEKFISLALGCCHDETDVRPSMSEVVRELENILHMMPEDATLEALETDSSKVVSVSFVSSESSGADHLVSSGIPAVAAR